MSATRNQFSLPGGTSKRRFPAVRTVCAAKLLPPLLLFTLPAAVQAQFTFTTNNDAITIMHLSCLSGAGSIPSTINGLPVTSIGDYAFEMASVTTVTIPFQDEIGPFNLKRTTT